MSEQPRTRSALLERLPWLVLIAGMLAFTITLTVLARWKALGLMPEWPLDLSFFHNLVWNVTHGFGYRQSATYHEPAGVFNETHFEPILLLAVPPYALVPRLTTLLAVQAGLLSLGAIGVYRLARSGGVSAWGAAGAGLVFLSWWPLWRMALADVRPLTWSIPFLLLCAAALREGRRAETLLWGVLACFSREEVPLIVAGLGATAWLWRAAPAVGDNRERRWLGARLAAACVVFLIAANAMRSNVTFYIRPDEWIERLMSGDSSDQVEAWGRSPGEMLETRARFLLEWAVPAGFGALLAPELLLGAVPLFAYLFSQGHEWAGWEGPYIHHSAPAVALVAAAAALGFARLVTRIPAGRWRLGVGVLLLAGLLIGHHHLLRDYHERVTLAEIEPWTQQQGRVVELYRLADQVPADAAVMSDYGTVHVFSGRHDVYSYQQEEIEHPRPPDGVRFTDPLLPPAPVQPTWALIHIDHPDWAARCRAAGLREVDRGVEWILFGPAGSG